MALTPLAGTSDLSDRGVTDGNLAVALEVASAAVREAAGVAITEETSTVVVNAGWGNLLPLPGPVTAVESVVVDGDTLDAGDYVVMQNGVWSRCGWGREQSRVTVTFTHGLATVPADIVDLTCQLAISWLSHTTVGGGSTAGLEYVAVDDAREGYTAEASGQVSPVFIPEVTRAWLARRFGGGAEVVEAL